MRDPVRHEDVHVGIGIPVANRDAHRTAIVGHLGRVADLFEAAITKVAEQHVVGDIIGNVEIRPAVAIDVHPRRGEATTPGRRRSGLTGPAQ